MDPVTRLRRSPWIVLGLAFLLVVGAVGATLLAPEGVDGQTARSSATGPHVTLYEGGLAFVQLERPLEDTADGATLTLTVPQTVILESLRVEGEGVNVQEIRADLATEPLLQPGEDAIVHVEGNRTYAGTLLGGFDHSGRLLLALDDGGEVQVPREKIVAIELPAAEATPRAPGAEATVTMDLALAPDAAGEVEVSYLARGPGWTPSYQLEVPEGNLTFLATLTGLMDWSGATVDLVSGSPHLVAHPTPVGAPERDFAVEAQEAAAAPMPVTGPEPLGALERFSLREPVDLKRGETVRVPVRAGPVEVVRHAYEIEAHTEPVHILEGSAEPVPVREVYELRNTLGIPLPPGTVELYRNGTWGGEDRLSAFPSDARANLTAATSEQLQARLTLENATSEPGRDVYTYGLAVENHRNETVDVRAALTYPERRANLLETTPEPTRVEGTTVVWEDTLPADTARTYRLTYEVIQETEPPRPEPAVRQG